MRDMSWVDRQEYPFESHAFEVPAGRLHYVGVRLDMDQSSDIRHCERLANFAR